MCIQHVPLSYLLLSYSIHSLIGGQTWWGKHTWRAPSGNCNTVNDIHNHLKTKPLGVKVEIGLIFMQDLH